MLVWIYTYFGEKKSPNYDSFSVFSDQRLRPSAEQLLKHSFIPQNETGVNSWETQKKGSCGHPQGLCV